MKLLAVLYKRGCNMRLFIAINFPWEVKEKLTAYSWAIRDASRQARPVDPENFHLTLAFLGELPDEIAASTALSRVAAAPFKLYSGKPGKFSRPDGDIRWLALKKSRELSGLQQQIVTALAAVGLPYEKKPFRPHLTLARNVQGLAEEALPEPPRFIVPVTSIELMHSHRPEGRLTYTPLYSRPLSD